MKTMAPALELGDKNFLDMGFEGVAVDRSIKDPGAMVLLEVVPATNVVVLQWRWGYPTFSAFPRAERP